MSIVVVAGLSHPGRVATQQDLRLTVAEWANVWINGQARLKATSRDRYEGILRTHVLPTWGDIALSNVSHAEVQTWVTRLAQTRSPATVHRVLSMVFDLAVRDGRLAR